MRGAAPKSCVCATSRLAPTHVPALSALPGVLERSKVAFGSRHPGNSRLNSMSPTIAAERWPGNSSKSTAGDGIPHRATSRRIGPVAVTKSGRSGMSILTRFWRRLDGPVHPDDVAILARVDHPFNLQFPPPVFAGDIDRAPVVLLSANGGWRDAATVEREMKAFGGVRGYIEYVRDPRPLTLHEQNNWLRAQFYSTYIADGRVATVNAIAYRSHRTDSISARLKQELPSLAVARRWLKDELLPAARAGQKLVVAHRYGFWGIRPGDGLAATLCSQAFHAVRRCPMDCVSRSHAGSRHVNRNDLFVFRPQSISEFDVKVCRVRNRVQVQRRERSRPHRRLAQTHGTARDSRVCVNAV